MENKKKCRFGFVILLLLLFTMSLGLFSTSYASQPTQEELVNFIELIKYKQNNNEFYSGIKINGNSTSIATNLLNATTNIDYSINNLVYAPSERVYGQSTTKYYSQGVFVIANLGMGNDSLDFLYTNKLDGNQPYVYLKNQNKTFYPIVYNINGNNIEILNNCNYLYVPSNNFTWSYNNDLDIFTNSFFFTRYKTATIYLQVSNTYYPMLNNYEGVDYNTYYNIVPEPEEPSGENSSTGTITDNNGETTGKIDLSGIENGITNIQNQISGDTQKVINNQNQNTQTIVNSLSGEVAKITNTLTDSADDLIDNTTITSGDIESALNFKIAQDPYSNFWLTLTDNLKSALLGTKRSIDISFQGRTWTISLDEYMVLPAWLIIILTPFSTAFFTWVLVRQFKLIFDKLASGNVDSLFKENSEERHFKFVLGGE